MFNKHGRMALMVLCPQIFSMFKAILKPFKELFGTYTLAHTLDSCECVNVCLLDAICSI